MNVIFVMFVTVFVLARVSPANGVATGRRDTVPSLFRSAGGGGGDGGQPQFIRVVAGGEQIHRSDAPYQVFLATDGLRCGGIILDSTHILTAAHCVRQENIFTHEDVDTGISVLATDQLGRTPIYNAHVEPADIIIHPRYSYKNPVHLRYANDLAMIRLSKPLPLQGNEGVLRPIALATADPALGQWARVSGFGNQNIKPFGQPEYGLGELRAVDVKVEACSGSLSWASQSSICTDNKGRQGQAAWGGKGDSGGPLVYKNQLVGVVQSIRGDGKGIYISVTKHREFIQSALQDRQVGANSGFVPSERGGTSNGPASGTASGAANDRQYRRQAPRSNGPASGSANDRRYQRQAPPPREDNNGFGFQRAVWRPPAENNQPRLIRT